MKLDSEIKQNVLAELQWDAEVDEAKIGVVVSNGTVTLSGTVDSMAEMDRVEAAVWAASGVTKVVDNLRVV